MRRPAARYVTRREGMKGAAALVAALLMSRPVAAQTSSLEALVTTMAPRELAARMFMLPVSGTSLTEQEKARYRAFQPGGVILVGSNFGMPDEVRSLVADIHATNPAWPPLVALDQEGGIVSRIIDDPAPAAPTMGTLALPEIEALARARSEVLATYGFDINFAPVADVAFLPDSFMADRAFGSDPERVAAAVSAYLQGVAGTRVMHCVKHFPGHGRVSVDSHEALPTLVVDPAQWWSEDALPFRSAIVRGVPLVMLGHLLVPGWDALPASISPEAVRVLRQDLGFGGVVVSDDMGMGALAGWSPFEIVDLALAAGLDLLVFVALGVEPEALVDHVLARVESGELAIDRLRASVTRLAHLHAAMA